MSLEATLATWELTKKQVSSQEKLFLLSLARRAGEDHTSWPSIQRMVEDTSQDRKTIVSIRQALIDRGYLVYTGEMKGRSKQIPVMRLQYVDAWEQKRNSPRLSDTDDLRVPTSPKNGTGKTSNSTENGMGTSPKNGTGTSTENGTLNIKGEYKRGNKSSCRSAPKKARSQKPKASPRKTKADYEEENRPHDWAPRMKVCEPVTDDPVQCGGCKRTTDWCTCNQSATNGGRLAPQIAQMFSKMALSKLKRSRNSVEESRDGGMEKVDRAG